jgi:Phosphoribosylamine-glycine ligase
MIVGIIGSGGREHAICKKVKESSKIDKIFCIPGNAGTNNIAENIDIKIDDFASIKNFCLKSKIELLIVGPEQPLVDGIVDYFHDTNINVFGPNKLASKLEGSKTFTKELCKKYDIPTANFNIFENLKTTELSLKNFRYPLVIKA